MLKKLNDPLNVKQLHFSIKLNMINIIGLILNLKLFGVADVTRAINRVFGKF